MSSWILDASAVLALINGEPGLQRVTEALEDGAAISTVNLAEVVTKLDDYGWSADEIRTKVRVIDFDILPFTAEDAHEAGLLRGQTRVLGLSLGDRACLATAARERVPALTTERTWARLPLTPPIAIEVIR